MKMFFTLRKNGSFKNCSLKGSLGNQNWFFYGIAVKTPFWKLYFEVILSQMPCSSQQGRTPMIVCYWLRTAAGCLIMHWGKGQLGTYLDNWVNYSQCLQWKERADIPDDHEFVWHQRHQKYHMHFFTQKCEGGRLLNCCTGLTCNQK